jgi:hypothetical protein
MMQRSKGIGIIGLLAAAGLAAAPMTGCEDLPGDEGTQGAVIGGAGGAVLGGAIADNTLLGALIGGALGAGGGYLIGANWDSITGDDEEGAMEAVQEAQRDPATASEARQAPTGDVNRDGFVTLDEVVAQERAGFSDEEIIRRLEATGQIFELTAEQQEYLLDQGVSARVVNALPTINQQRRQELLQLQQQRQPAARPGGGGEVIGRPR